MSHVPRSKEFDDVYFSAVDGLAETRYVFLEGNGLPETWAGHESFTICESGFGTGLNFLAVLQLWLESNADQRPNNLHFISFEKYPLEKDVIDNSLSHWGELKNVLAKLLAVYPNNLDHNICDGIKLTLIIGDINDEMPKLETQVDCWFLDGFKPLTNPDMWSKTVFENMARLSNNGASFATFTSAGFVRRGLEDVGFNVHKIRGFGNKRELCVGTFIVA